MGLPALAKSGGEILGMQRKKFFFCQLCDTFVTTHLQQYIISIYDNPFATIYCVYLWQPVCNNITIYLQQTSCSYLQTTYWAICYNPFATTQGELLACTPKLWLSLISQLVKSVCTLAHFRCCYHVKIFQKQHVRVHWHWTKYSKFIHQFHGHGWAIIVDLSIIENKRKELF